MRTRALATLVIVATLALAGCSAPADDDASTAPAASSTPQTLVAEQTTAATQPESTDSLYLADVRKALTNGRETTIPDATDEQLVAAAHDACEQAAGGATEATVQVIEGEPFDADWGAYRDSATILIQAQKYYC